MNPQELLVIQFLNFLSTKNFVEYLLLTRWYLAQWK